MASSVSQHITTTEADGPIFYNSTVPSTVSRQAVVNSFIEKMNQTNVNNTMAHLSLSYYNRFFQVLFLTTVATS